MIVIDASTINVALALASALASAENTKGGSITVRLTSCLTGLD